MKQLLSISLLAAALIIAAFIFQKSCSIIDRVTDAENIISSYEEFERLYSSANEACNKIAILKSYAEEVSGGFSKAERVLAMESKLEGIIAVYNAKSRMIHKNKWKNSDLPYQLSRKYFVCE